MEELKYTMQLRDYASSCVNQYQDQIIADILNRKLPISDVFDDFINEEIADMIEDTPEIIQFLAKDPNAFLAGLSSSQRAHVMNILQNDFKATLHNELRQRLIEVKMESFNNDKILLLDKAIKDINDLP
jgi:hypothetical protein